MLIYTHWASLMAQWVKNLTAMQETQDTLVWFLGWEDTLEKGGGNPFQYSCLKNPIDGGTWWAAVQKIAKSQIYTDSYLTEQLSTHTRLYTLQFSRSVISNSLPLHELQHARPPCPSPTSRVHPNPCPSSRWYYLTISSSVVPFSSCPQSFPASGSFPVS